MKTNIDFNPVLLAPGNLFWPENGAGFLYLRPVITAILVIIGIFISGCEESTQNRIRMATFSSDATPGIGVPLAYDPTKKVDMPLSARGIVLIGNGKPIVLCAVDWIGIGNKARDAWQEALAEAAGTRPERVTIHALHQHDAPMGDYNAYDILNEFGIDPEDTRLDNREFVEQSIEKSATALRNAMENELVTVTHIGTGTGIVEKVASNRRLINRKGKVEQGRMSSTRDVAEQRAPVGTIDPEVKLLSFWEHDEPVVVMSYYACHPQSFYRTGRVNPDFPGIARQMREEVTGVRHIHFNGAGGNVAAGKWNNGWTRRRHLLAERLARGMEEAWEQTERVPVTADQLGWQVEPVVLPPGEHLKKGSLEKVLQNADTAAETPTGAARNLNWVRRCMNGDKINLTALRIGPARVLHTPGELAVEYQLYARSLYPDDFIAHAAYGDYDPGYISTEIQYFQGGYEASDRASRVAPAVEQVLLPAIQKVLAFEALRPDSAKIKNKEYHVERFALQYGYDWEYSWVNGGAGVIPADASINPLNKPTIVIAAHQVDHAGPDVFRGLHTFRSRDLGLTWEGPFEEPAFQREAMEKNEDLEKLVTNFTPKYHVASNTMLGIGHSAIYEGNRLMAGNNHGIAYAKFNVSEQKWSEAQTLELPGEDPFDTAGIASGRRVDLEDGTILFPVYWADDGDSKFHVTIIRCDFDGDKMHYEGHGNQLTINAGSKFNEPAFKAYKGRYYLVVGNDEEVFIAQSKDRLQFDKPQPVQSENGGDLVGGNTRRQWVAHSNGLYLAYTSINRDTLFLSKVDPDKAEVISDAGKPVITAERGGRLDHLDVTHVSKETTWIIATEWIEPEGVGGDYAGNNLIHIARLNW